MSTDGNLASLTERSNLKSKTAGLVSNPAAVN